MDLGIEGKRVLITGASRGIGKATALEFAKENCRVTVIARNENKLEEVVKQMGGIEKGHSLCSVDLMRPGTPTKTVIELIKKEPYDIVIHNVGGTLNVKDILSPIENWQKVWQYNVGIAIEMNRYLIPPMQKQKWGRIIHISSISAKNLRGSGPYGAAKSFLNAYTQVVGKGVAKDGIVVSALMPGAVYSVGGPWDENSDINKDDKGAFFRKKADFLRHHHACGRLGTAEEIAPFAIFMASKYVTFANGTLINIDGGTE